ncbi:MAG TPA: response regulator transcription factor, partial [Chloroflexota bacterium]
RYHVLVASNGREALDLARSRRPDLIVLDLMLPGVDGLDVCRILRAESKVPIIMLTAKTTEEDKLLGLDLGADDYIVKPFSPRELVARVRVLLRRLAADEEPQPRLQAGELIVDLATYEVWRGETSIHLTPKEFKLLSVLMRSPNRVFTRNQLLDHVFGPTYDGGERTIDVHLMNLRKKIEGKPEQPVYVQTVFGVGYKFAAPVASVGTERANA